MNLMKIGTMEGQLRTLNCFLNWDLICRIRRYGRSGRMKASLNPLEKESSKWPFDPFYIFGSLMLLMIALSACSDHGFKTKELYAYDVEGLLIAPRFPSSTTSMFWGLPAFISNLIRVFTL